MRAAPALVLLGSLWVFAASLPAQAPVSAPRIWDDAALADWATPVAGLNVRPSHYSSAQYYSVPADNLRTYPVYAPGREPAGNPAVPPAARARRRAQAQAARDAFPGLVPAGIQRR